MFIMIIFYVRIVYIKFLLLVSESEAAFLRLSVSLFFSSLY